MKKSWQRLGSAFLAFLMVFTMLPASVLADSGTAAGDSLNVSGTPAVRSVINPGTDSSSYQTYRFYVEGTLVDTQVVKTGDTLYAPATPAKEGHKFLGWSQSQSGGSYFTAFGAQTVTADGEVNLYADFAKVYYVFFMDTRGRVYATKEGTTGDSIAADVTFPVNADQAITGWYTEAGLTNRVESVTLGEANITLYPKVENGHWITYDSKGGSYVEPAFVAPSGVTVAPAAPSRPGYTFGGWTRNGSAFTFGGALSENIQLEASWRAGTNTAYTVIHWWENADNDQYAFHESENRTGASGAQTAASAKSYTGFTAQTITQQTIEGDGSTIVNVYYDRNEYSVKFYQYQSSGWSGSWNELTGLRITAKYGANISDQWPSSTSMIWGTTKGNRTGASPYQSGIDTMPLNGDEFYYVNQSGKYTMSLKYYTEVLDGATGSDIVTYQGKRYRLDHTDSFKSDNTRWSTTAEDHYPITGFTYTNNLPDGSSFTNNGSNNYSVTFYYNRNDYSINFSNGGNVTHSEAKQYQADISGVSYTPTRPSGVPESYVFQGWYDNEMFAGDPYVFTGTMPANNIIVYAKWAAPTFTGTIHVTMAGSGATNIIEIPYGSTIDESTLGHEEVPAGSEWVGWALRTGSEGHYTYTPFNFDTRIYGDITLYPYYISTTAFTVSYDANSGSGAPADSKRYAQDSYAEIMASSGMTAPANKIFLSWNTESDGSGDTYYPKDKLHIGTENITLYAQWGDAPVPVSVSYHANYPDSTTADPYVVSGLRNNDQHTVLSLEGCGFTKAQADYEFLGWSTSESDTEAEYAVGAQIRLDSNGENHLYAIWKAKPVLAITANSSSRSYDGTALTADGYKLTVNGGAAIEVGADGVYTFENGDVLTVEITGSQTDAGESANTVTSYTIQRGAAAVTGKYKVTTVNGKLEVTKKAVTITAATEAFTYDGSAHSDARYTVTGLVGSDKVTATVAGSITYPSQSPVKNEVTSHTFTAGRADNYTVSYADGQLTMTYGEAQAITVTADNGSWTYDGNAHAQDSYTVKIGDGKPQPVGAAGVYTFANGDVLTVVVEGSVTNVAEGEVTNAITSLTITNQGEDVSGAYSITRNNGTLKINPKAVRVIAASEAFKYDGKAHSNAGYTAEGLVGSDAISAVVEGSITYPSQSPVDNVLKSYEFTSGTAGNYSVTTENGTLTMSYADAVEITVTAGSKSWTYDGNAHSQDSYTLKIGNGAPIPVGADGIYTFENGDVLTVEITGSVTNVAEGTVANTISSLTITNGTVDVSGAYAVTRSNGTLKINPKTVTIKAADDDFTYDGSAHSNANYTVTGLVGSDAVTATVAGSITYPSQSPVKNEVTGHTFTAGSADNYTVSYTDGQLTMTYGAAQAITVTADNKSWTYDGNAHSQDSYTLKIGNDAPISVGADGVYTFANGDVLTVEITGSVTNVAEGTVANTVASLTITNGAEDVSAAYAVTRNNGTLKIDPKAVTITAKSKEFEYDGQPHSYASYSVNGLVGDDEISATVTGSITYPSESPVANQVTAYTFVKGAASNYTVEYADGTLTMVPSTTEVTVTITGNHDSKVYNASEQSVTGFTTDVGEKTISVVLADGSDAVAKGTDVGNYKMGLTEDDFVVTSDNYSNIKVVVVDGYLDITPVTDEVTVTITGNHDSKVYNASEQSVTGFTTDVGTKAISVVLADGSEAVAKGTDVGNYKMGLTEDNFVVTSDNYGNIKVVVVDGYLDITPVTDEVTVTITGNHDSRVYNTSEQSVTGFTTDVGTKAISVVLADGSEAVAKGTDVGNYKMGLTEDDFVVTSDNYGNIKVVVVDGYLDITPTSDEVTVTITGHTDTRTYNGREYTVTGYDVSSSNPFYTEADFRFNGTASVSGTDADSYPMGLTEDDFSNTNRNFSNVVFDVTDGGLTIDPKAVTITAASEEFEYNGQPRSNAGYTVEGLVGSDAISAVVEGSITYPSQSPVKNTVVSHEFTTGNPNNYEVSYAVGELTMTAASGEIVVTITGKNDTAKYDGEEHTVTGYDVTISSVLYTENDFTFNGTASASRIDAGTTDMGLTAEDFVNHNDSFSNVVFVVEDGFVTVEKRVLTLTSASDEKLYDSYPLRNDKVTVSGDGFAEGEGAVYDVTGVQRGPGDSKNTFDYLLNDGTKAENYEITKVEGTLKITAPDSLYYSIEYYYNGIINPSMTRTVSGVKLGDVIENVDAASITEGELSGNYKFIEAVGLPLTIGVETSENVLRLYYESGEIAHDPDAAIQIIHQYYTDGRFSGEQKRSLDSAEAGQQIYIDNRNMPANQVIRSAPIYGRRGYDFDGSRIRVERTPFSYEVIFHGNGFVADPASISVNYKSNFTIPADGTANLIWMTEKGKKLVAEVIEAIETTGIDSGSDSADFLAYLMAQRYPNEHGKEYFFPGQEYPLATAANLDLYAYVLKRTTLTNADISEAFAQAESDLIALKRAVARGVDPEDTGFVGTLRSLFGMKKVDPDLKARYQACYEALSDEIYELGDLLDRFEEENDKKLSEKTWERYGNLLAGLNELEEMIENLDVIIDSGYQDSGYQDSGYLDSGFTVTRTSSGSGVSVQKKSVSFLEGLFGGMQVAQVIDYGTSATYPMTITKLDSFLYEEGYTYTVTLTYNRTTGGGGGGDNDDPTPIPDNPVPLGPSPDLVTILDEEVPLGKLPTSGSNRNAHRAGGAALMAVILGLLAKGRRRDGEGGSGEGTDSSGE
ncbi:InlB B-repeat-containing protein [Faecalicatena sp. BF-R-105]|nr:InlB B-repeat-containing protein [Faecalicatena sp. BF-R-105]